MKRNSNTITTEQIFQVLNSTKKKLEITHDVTYIIPPSSRNSFAKITGLAEDKDFVVHKSVPEGKIIQFNGNITENRREYIKLIDFPDSGNSSGMNRKQRRAARRKGIK